MAVGDDPDDHGEDQQADHVVDHGRTEHRTGLDGGQGPEVPEDPRGDLDTGDRFRSQLIAPP